MPGSAQAIAELAREAQLRQLSALDSLDTKSATLVGFAGVVLGLLFSSPVATDHWNAGLTTGASATAVSILVLAIGILPRRYASNPNILALATGYMDKAPEETYQSVVESINRGITFNANRQLLKATFLRFGAVLLLIGFLTMTVSLIYTVETQHPTQPIQKTKQKHTLSNTRKDTQE